MAIHTHDDTVTENPPSTASRPSTTSATTQDQLTKRVTDYLARPARTSIQEYLRINAAASYLKAVREQPASSKPTPQPQPHPKPTSPGKKAAACIVGCLLESRLNPNKKSKAEEQGTVLKYLGAYYETFAPNVRTAFTGKDKVPFIELVESIIENVEDKDGNAFHELLIACGNDG